MSRRPSPAPDRTLGASALRMLRQANRLLESGKTEQAYPLFKRQADVAARQGMPVQAAHLYLLAAHARLGMGGTVEAIALIRQAIQLLPAAQIERLRWPLLRLIQELEQYGSHELAVSLRAEMSALLGGTGTHDARATEKGRLPRRCPSCGGSLHADEAVWTDSHRVECVYCGALITTEKEP